MPAEEAFLWQAEGIKTLSMETKTYYFYYRASAALELRR